MLQDFIMRSLNKWEQLFDSRYLRLISCFVRLNISNLCHCLLPISAVCYSKTFSLIIYSHFTKQCFSVLFVALYYSHTPVSLSLLSSILISILFVDNSSFRLLSCLQWFGNNCFVTSLKNLILLRPSHCIRLSHFGIAINIDTSHRL